MIYPDTDIDEIKRALERGPETESPKKEGPNKADNGKLHLSWVPIKAIVAIAIVREYGVRKYHDINGWKSVQRERYKEALFRHVAAIWADTDAVDDESHLPHLWHIACNAAFLIALGGKVSWEETKKMWR